MQKNHNHFSNNTTELRLRAEARLRGPRNRQGPRAGKPKSNAEPVRVLHELEIHQIELEMQNAELQKAREELELALEKYTDLYDFAPVGYFSLDPSGVILEVNLTGASLLGLERSRLLNRRLQRFLVPRSQPIFQDFLARLFARTGKQACEAELLKADTTAFWASFHGAPAVSPGGSLKSCGVAVSDITSRKQAEEAQLRMETLAATNQEMKREIVRRQAVEEALKKSERQQSVLLKQSHRMQEQLRHLSRQVLRAQEEERKRISRELHDVIAQSLAGINVQLASLKKSANINTKALDRNVARTQAVVQQALDIVHRFARELRPTVLDDLGLIPALQAFMKTFRAETGIHVSLSAFAAVDQINGDNRTVLYRVAQEALTNIARHAHASRVEVSIQKLDGAVGLTIHDDGKGFQTDRTSDNKQSERLGLIGMRERLEMVRGSFDIRSAPGKGTTVRAQVPITNNAGGGARRLRSLIKFN